MFSEKTGQLILSDPNFNRLVFQEDIEETSQWIPNIIPNNQTNTNSTWLIDILVLKTHISQHIKMNQPVVKMLDAIGALASAPCMNHHLSNFSG